MIHVKLVNSQPLQIILSSAAFTIQILGFMPSYFIGRQPILDAMENTIGYELLFRSSTDNTYDPTIDGDSATARVLINSILESGLHSLIGSQLAFINCTNLFLENPDLLDLLPPEQCVLEVLETVVVTDKLVAGIKKLRNKGFSIALDDYNNNASFDRLKPLADIIKYDLTQYNLDVLAEFREKDNANDTKSLVERVEHREDFYTLKDAGFNYFQGYYFAKPLVISGSRLSPSKLTVLQLLSEINDPRSNINDIARIVSRDASLGIRTLKYVNSPITGLSATVKSVKHATVLLGRATIRNWVSLMVMTDLAEKPAELVKMALIRARFCQLMAREERLKEEGMYFTIGLLSLIDALTDTRLEVALHEIKLDTDMIVQMTERSGVGGYMLNTVELLEKPETYRNHQLELQHALKPYRSALQWAEQAYLINKS